MVTKDKLFLVKSLVEFEPKERVSNLPNTARGVYVLLDKRVVRGREVFDVVYVGMSRWSMRHRLAIHSRSKRKAKLWTHFSAYEVNENIPSSIIVELEGLLRAIYRKDSNANRINKYKGFKAFLPLPSIFPG